MFFAWPERSLAILMSVVYVDFTLLQIKQNLIYIRIQILIAINRTAILSQIKNLVKSEPFFV
jgi:hypothetical protein